jgi:hypothetical protein
VAEYKDHHHQERNHQELKSRLIQPPTVVISIDTAIHRHSRLAGTLNLEYGKAACLHRSRFRTKRDSSPSQRLALSAGKALVLAKSVLGGSLTSIRLLQH